MFWMKYVQKDVWVGAVILEFTLSSEGFGLPQGTSFDMSVYWSLPLFCTLYSGGILAECLSRRHPATHFELCSSNITPSPETQGVSLLSLSETTVRIKSGANKLGMAALLSCYRAFNSWTLSVEQQKTKMCEKGRAFEVVYGR